MREGRTERLAQEFQQEIARIVQRELKHPGLGFVTITRVKLSPDGSHAKVFYSSLGASAERRANQAALERSAAYIYSLLKKRFRLKVIPALAFEYDPSIAGAIAMSETLERLSGRPDPAPPGTEGEVER
jgi:ribosome-binding factor A